MGAGSNGVIFNDLEGPLTWISRSLYNYKLNVSKTVHLMDKVSIEQLVYIEIICNLSNDITFNGLDP